MPGTDEMYDDLHEWVLLSLLGPRDQRALVAWTSRRGEVPMAPGDREAAPAVRLRYDGTREQRVSIGGHKVRVCVTDALGGSEDRPWKPPEIIFTASSATARDALLAEVSRVVQRSHQRKHKPSFRMLSQWGDWERLDDLAGRDLDSVILPPWQLDRLIGDVGRFLAAEQEYVRRAVFPWHRAHLYGGEPPGTGKTSVARARYTASHFGMDVSYLAARFDVKKRTVTCCGSRTGSGRGRCCCWKTWTCSTPRPSGMTTRPGR